MCNEIRSCLGATRSAPLCSKYERSSPAICGQLCHMLPPVTTRYLPGAADLSTASGATPSRTQAALDADDEHNHARVGMAWA